MSSEYASPARTETPLAIPLQKIRDSSTALGMTKWALTRDERLSCRGFAALSIERQKLKCRLTDTALQSLC